MKKSIVSIILICIIAAISLFFWSRSDPGPLWVLQHELNKRSDIVYATGKDNVLEFHSPDSDAVVVISPPYYLIKNEKIPNISKETLNIMQEEINVSETGHIFYIRNNSLLDHRLLSGLAEPVYGVSSEGSIKFLISPKTTSGRPVRIEMIRGGN